MHPDLDVRRESGDNFARLVCVEKGNVLAQDGVEQVLPHLLRHPLACVMQSIGRRFATKSHYIHMAKTRTLTLTDAGEAVDVGERHGTLGEVQLDHLECRLLDLGEEAFDGLCSGGGLTASRNHVHNVAEKLWNLQGKICMVEYRVP